MLLLPPALGAGWSPTPQPSGLRVKITKDPVSLFIHEPFTIRLDVRSDAAPKTPEVPEVPGMTVVSVRPLPADTARQTHAFRIELIAERAGLVTLPPFPVHAGGRTAMTAALPLRIREPRPATEMTLEITIEPTELRVGQPADVSITWTSALSFSRCKQLVFEVPLLADPRCRIFARDPAVPDAEQMGLPVNNARVLAVAESLPDQRQRLSFRYQLIPQEPCVLRSRPARLACAVLDAEPSSGQPPGYFYNQFFEAPAEGEAYQRLYRVEAVPQVTVSALPASGRDARFADIVGPCKLHTTVAPDDLVVGQPALLTVHLRDMAFARHLADLPSAAFDGLRPDFLVSDEAIRATATDHDRTFTRVLRPLRSGIHRIPAVVVQIFDPDSEQYRTLRSEPIPITVVSDPSVDTRALLLRSHSQPPIPIMGIRHNRIDGNRSMSVHTWLEFFGRLWWVFLPLPPLAWLVMRPRMRQWERCRRDAKYARAVTAWGRFRRAASHDEEAAWRNYLADRLGLCADALTAMTVTRALQARQVEADLVAETRRRFAEQDAVDYGKRSVAPTISTQQLVRRLQRATVPSLLLVCGVFRPLCVDASQADVWFDRAMQMREEKPDEAQPLFVEAALGFESEQRFVDAGNGWVFAGETGRALANFRAAEARAPFDRQVRESIAFLRAGRADAFPPPATPSGRLATTWNRFCTWAPVLRVGLFVVVYLAAGTVFLATQMAGWRVRRTAWALLLVAALVPLASLVQTRLRPSEGIVIEDSIARLGPGYAYDPAFEQPLHEAAEFSWVESRHGWVRARLPDASEGWLRETDCLQVR